MALNLAVGAHVPCVMRQSWRWTITAAVIAVFVALPFAAHLLPAGHSDIGARTLFQRIRASGPVGYSGLAQSTGGLSLPLKNDPFDSIEGLFDGTKQLRVWWRNTSDWRVDTLSATGESDLHHDGRGEWTWDYESNTARYTDATTTPVVRLPRGEDLLPPTLAQRLLSEAAPSAASRLPSARIAGHEAAGLRVRVTDPRSTIRHIDVWADPDDGLALRVSVYGTGARPIISTSFLDLTIGTPPSSVTSFHPAAGEQAYAGQVSDIVAAIDRFGRSKPPAEIAGLPRRRDLQLGAVGVYGRGATVLVALPLDYRLANDVLPSLADAPGATRSTVHTGNGTSYVITIGDGPINLQVSSSGQFGGDWLLVGTVRKAALQQAVPALPPVRDNEFGR